ncbi:hypothetical protein BJX96DRAFT_147641 [Aspergillus floccosus]
MRPALLRLLKRPSALSVIDSLISRPVGIEQLESRYRSECVRYHSQSSQSAGCMETIGLESTKQSPTRRTRPPPSFRVHGIQPPSSEETHKDGRIPCRDPNTRPALLALGLRPDKLEFESDIGHTDDIGTRLVDDPANRHNFALWEELLRYRQRHYGEKGTLDIWEGMISRVDGIELPVSGERADFFWQSFVELGLKREVMMRELVSYAYALWDRTGARWDGFYESVVAGFIERGMTHRAVEWHKKLRNPHLAHPNEVLRVLSAAVMLHHQTGRRSASPVKHIVSPGLSAFQNICRATPGHRIYGPVLSTLLTSDCIEEVFPMHTFMIEQGDHPSSFEEIRALLEYAEQCGPSNFAGRLRRYAADRFPDEIKGTQHPKDERSSLSSKQSEPWPREKPFKDEFGARIFATKALNFDMILSGLRMFNVPAIGPHSLREMAIRAHGGHDILDKLQRLEEAGISIGDSVFSRLLRKLAGENRSILLSDLLHSDQHPDMLEDAQAQESLLVSYYVARDWRLYNMTSAILSELCNDEIDLLNIHFRKYVAAREFGLASKTVDDMVLRGMTLTGQSIDYMVSQVLAPRRLGVGPVQGSSMSPVQEVNFVFCILQRVLPAGTSVSPDLWVEILKRLGMTGSWNELQRCCEWLARHYSFQTNRADVFDASKRANCDTATVFRQRNRRILETIFSRRMQAAIVAWGFKKRVSSKPRDEPVPWVRGFTLLRTLEKNGVHLWEDWIRRACRHRLAVLYGSPRQSSRLMNRLLRRENPYSLGRVINDINCAWGEPLFTDPEHGDVVELVNPPSSGMSQRRTQRTIFREAHFRRGAFVRTR